MKKKIIFFSFVLIILIAGFNVYAQKKTEVFLKYSKQEGFMRIVLESEESFITKSQANIVSNQIKIDFPDSFSLTPLKTPPFEVVQANKTLTINIKEKAEIKTFKLSSPARIVFDIKSPDIHPEKTSGILLNSFVIDAGHGGYDFGIIFREKNEKDICLDIAKELSNYLVKKGKKVFLTRKVDQYLQISERISFTNIRKPDVFISLHISNSGKFAIYKPYLEDKAGSETLNKYSLEMKQKKYLSRSKELADSLINVFKEEFKEQIVLREMPLPLLNSIGAPAVMIEFPYSQFIMYDQQRKTKIVNALIKAFLVYGQTHTSLEYFNKGI
ncbi:MAG: N-acetylmuramoyl-L-alanine amidase [Nitrospirae bacterium]|nr:N-acetylmuramoyl-L-alanine amidase [Nitrospirota bacterium]